MNRRTFSKIFAATTALSLGISKNAFSNPNSTDLNNQHGYPKKIVKPARLRAGDTIGLIAPSSPISEERLEKTIKNIEGLGFRLKFSRNNVLAHRGYLAGSDQLRAREVNQMFADPDVKGIWCVRGGYGSARILPMLDYRLIQRNPKVLIGYSDITALLQGIFLRTGLVCFHGPSGASEYPAYTTKHVLNLLTNPCERYTIEYAQENLMKEDKLFVPSVIREGSAKGELIGGNLTLIASLIGTPYDINMNHKIIFLEDISERPYRIDRLLTQLILAGKFKKAKGVILGVFNDCEAREGENSLSLSETLKDRLYDLKIPVVYGMAFGHIDNQFAIPLGINAEMDSQSFDLSLLEAAVL